MRSADARKTLHGGAKALLIGVAAEGKMWDGGCEAHKSRLVATSNGRCGGSPPSSMLASCTMCERKSGSDQKIVTQKVTCHAARRVKSPMSHETLQCGLATHANTTGRQGFVSLPSFYVI